MSEPNLKKIKLNETINVDDENNNNGLSLDQTYVLSMVKNGKNLFYTGPAGTGKSFLLGKIIEELYETHKPGTIAITASTGNAAININGQTLHSFAGVGLAEDDAETLAERVGGNSSAKKRWQQTEVLIIDEISMIPGALFDKIEFVARQMKNNGDKPFGDIQVILCGDFLQLPPVSKNKEKDYCFTAKCWEKVIGKNVFQLSTSFRQKDLIFFNLLNQIRIGNVPKEIVAILNQCVDKKFPNTFIKPTLLFPRKDSVNEVNEKELKEIKSLSFIYESVDWGDHPEDLKFLESNCMAVKKLELKVGAQVMLIKNMDIKSGLVNGSRGYVKAFADDEKVTPIVCFSDGSEIPIAASEFTYKRNKKTIAIRTQIPLILAYALSIHKSQGMSIDFVQVEISNCFEPGHAYVALSRAKSLQGLSIQAFDKSTINAHPKVLEFYETTFKK